MSRSSTGRRVLVVGATGTQGGATVDALLADGHAVRGLTRDATSDAARRLADRGVEVVASDLSDPAMLGPAFDGCDAVFHPSFGADEVGYARNVLAAARDAGVAHLVVSTGGNCDDRPGVPHVDAKADVEELVQESGLDWTMLRPHTFYSNLAMQAGALAQGRFPYPLAEGSRLALVDPRDIGRLAARAVADPDGFAGETFELAGEALTLEELAATFADYLGRPVDPVRLTPAEFVAEMGAPPAFERFLAWQSEPHPIDTERLASEYEFETTSLANYLTREWPEADLPTPPRSPSGAPGGP
jgi:uncharacterized protein YbjT (DUF2867 family)